MDVIIRGGDERDVNKKGVCLYRWHHIRKKQVGRETNISTLSGGSSWGLWGFKPPPS